ncbi:MAG: hypothetical protein ACRDDY_19905 [Clostridium sp.]|uniref:hypothetical protein n=1 Tax=Clostridium sp. TaxID=1506 RepID=UPI003EE42DAE
MGISKFSKSIYKRENNKPFIITIAIIAVFMYNTISTYYNESIYKITEPTIEQEFMRELGDGWMTIYNGPAGNELQMNLFLVLSAGALLAIFSTVIYTREKGKNIACMFYSGGSYGDAFKFLLYNTMKSFSIGYVIGTIVGVIVSPLYNIIIYKMMGISGPIFTPLGVEGVTVAVLFVMIIMAASLTVDWGFIYRKDTLGLMTLDGAKNLGDKRSTKLHWSIVILLYLFPLIYVFIVGKVYGIQDHIGLLSYLSLSMLYWLVTYSLGDLMESLKKRKFMYKKGRIIYLGNALKTVKESFSYITIFLFVLIYTVNGVSGLIHEAGVKEGLALSLVGIGLCIAVSLGYKLNTEFEGIKDRAMQLRLIGFSDKQVLDCVKDEVISIFMFVIGIPLMILGTNLLAYAFQESFSYMFALGTMIGVCAPVVIVAVVITVYYEKGIRKTLKSKENISLEAA